MTESLTLSNKDFCEIALELEPHHVIFSKIWNIGKPRFTDKIPTSCVTFDREGNYFDFQFNPVFWNSIKSYERNFVICHECLHIILTHGIRLKSLIKQIANISADLVINEMLVNGFGFDRNKLEFLNKEGCWLDTVFKDLKTDVDKNRSVEYYYNILKNEFESLNGFDNLKFPDCHEGICDINPEDLSEIFSNILDELNGFDKESLNNSLNNNSNENIQSGKQAGSVAGCLEKIIRVGKVKHKKKWETVIKKWVNHSIKDIDKDREQWARVNRRFVGISTNLFLPSEMEIEDKDDVIDKIKLIFFQDTSGSCLSLAERFFKVAKSIPTDRFDVKTYCFDTEVYETDINTGKLFGFGGTSFSILEQKVMEICNGNLSKYPKAIFVITDGYGDEIKPVKPKNWHWFLSGNYAGCIPKECNIHNLLDFE